jgi:hypothetical protein
MSQSTEKKPLTPVLIIPGFMSSGMVVAKSPHKPWEGERIWLNISQMGFQSLHIGGALRLNEQARASPQNTSEGNKSRESSDALHQEYTKEMECKSRWVQHMCLQYDMKSEKDGIEVRPIAGCSGVDYLAPGALTDSMSKVFGPVLKLLKSKGYEEGINLDAAPYDWRLPPNILQERDKYFTNTMETIAHLYRQSNNTPVVILCHSMGCKTGHYLFNFVRHHLGEQDGQKWLDKYIHSYVPVGAPHIGAPKSVRSVFDGEKMGLDSFLDDDEGLMLSRSLGSTPWLFPLENTSATPLTPSVPPSVLRLESSIILTIPTQTIPMKSFVYRRESMPSKVRLAIHLAKDFVVRTEFYPLSRDKKSPMLTLEEEVWSVAVPPTIDQTLKLYPKFEVHLEELGAGQLPRKQRRGVYHCDILWPCRFAFCVMKWILCLPCAIVLKILRLLARGANRGIDLTAGAVGSFRAIGKSNKINWAKVLRASSKAASNDGGESGGVNSELRFQMLPCDREGQGFFFELPSPQECVFKIKWRPPSSLLETKPFDRVTDKKTAIHQYYPASTGALLETEGLDNAVKLLRDSYCSDPVDPRGLSSWHPPPIQKVVAIYGINLPTETSSVYQHKQCVKLSCTTRKDLCVRQLIVLDKNARLAKGLDGYTIKDGIIREIKVRSNGTTTKKSGDGTVPYWSLQHCRTWQGEGVKKCDVKVYEIEGAEHLAILHEAKFHKILLEVLGCS